MSCVDEDEDDHIEGIQGFYQGPRRIHTHIAELHHTLTTSKRIDVCYPFRKDWRFKSIHHRDLWVDRPVSRARRDNFRLNNHTKKKPCANRVTSWLHRGIANQKFFFSKSPLVSSFRAFGKTLAYFILFYLFIDL